LGDGSGAYRMLIGRQEGCIQDVDWETGVVHASFDWETGGVHTGC